MLTDGGTSPENEDEAKYYFPEEPEEWKSGYNLVEASMLLYTEILTQIFEDASETHDKFVRFYYDIYGFRLCDKINGICDKLDVEIGPEPTEKYKIQNPE